MFADMHIVSLGTPGGRRVQGTASGRREKEHKEWQSRTRPEPSSRGRNPRLVTALLGASQAIEERGVVVRSAHSL